LSKAAPYLEIKPLPASLLASRVQFVRLPVPGPARNTWYLGRVLEILSQTLFPDEDPNELFCQKYQRTNRERIERVRFLIERDLENPPSLLMLAQETGCSPFYLSRVFAQESGVSIPKFLRLKRIEKAAELLRAGRANVTEAAVAVGYTSLSAFNKAFVEHFGCCPGLYPHGKIPGRGGPAQLRDAYDAFFGTSPTLTLGSAVSMQDITGAGFVTWDLSSTVKSWLDGSLANNGILISLSTNGGDIGFADVDSSPGVADSAPRLTVNAVPEPSATVAAIAGLGLLSIVTLRRRRRCLMA
jgi:AraC-like DNA-binding protein